MATSNIAYVPTTNSYEVSQLFTLDVNSNEFKELLARLYQTVYNIAIVLNMKETGTYDVNEFITSSAFFSNPAFNTLTSQKAQDRSVFRKVINFGALPNATTKSVAHGLTILPSWIFTRIYATATDNTNGSYVPIPYSSCTDVAHNIELNVDNTNVNITTGTNRSSYTICYVILEYLKF